ncbi:MULTISPECIES: EamA family transporter RarD [Vibrio]|uniref:EamA family transporter RarD n=1 Tax=Vibrio coralliilyticus TaxID=190893 RepID=A0AAP7DG73_9VIBR|nr:MULTISPECIES: EamA family transporter RarD [Vibrio]EEX33517.1 RarD protein [Vibrio coralliilyticus ATCC BAA-450]MCM5509606.1 EamA family transporter RarD [Vibrio sp. SCSIO 43169]MDE3895983.1 EamA family transporter RarD [Vibrio sp. CC007]NOI60516.1 EamA family transporter RarD [Vibrio coralliilyticus]NOJ25420.1 EamA family transporter RarD [Vibrio coralliilyticus]
MSQERTGNWMAALSFLLWGLLPLYYQYLPNAALDELLTVRLVASVPFGILIVLFVTKRMPDFSAIFADRRSLAITFLGSTLMSISWCAFTWAITNDRVIDASLGFFISPLTMTALGVFVLGEKLSLGKKVALVLASAGLSYQVMQYGQVPVIALTMAIFFTLYGWCKKKIRYEWSTCLFVEALALTPFALGYLIFKEATVGTESLNSGWETFALYVGAAPATLIPLLFYSLAIRLTSMSTVGLMQYIEPSIQFLLAIYLFGEVFDEVKLVSFSLIWAGLLFTIAESAKNRVVLKRS